VEGSAASETKEETSKAQHSEKNKWRYASKLANSSFLINMMKVVATIFQRIMAEFIWVDSEEDGIMIITENTLKLMKKIDTKIHGRQM
jgi:hypothetical protein